MRLLEFSQHAGEVPFMELGRSWMGWDCWGLVWVAYRDVLHIELQLFNEGYTSTRQRNTLAAIVQAGLQDEWKRVERPREMDVAIMRMLGRPCHVGLMIDPHQILHACEGTQAIVEDRRYYPWAQPGQIEGFYRYVE